MDLVIWLFYGIVYCTGFILQLRTRWAVFNFSALSGSGSTSEPPRLVKDTWARLMFAVTWTRAGWLKDSQRTTSVPLVLSILLGIVSALHACNLGRDKKTLYFWMVCVKIVQRKFSFLYFAILKNQVSIPFNDSLLWLFFSCFDQTNIPVLIPGDMFFTSSLSEISSWRYTWVSLKQVAILRVAQGQTCGWKHFLAFGLSWDSLHCSQQ